MRNFIFGFISLEDQANTQKFFRSDF